MKKNKQIITIITELNEKMFLKSRIIYYALGFIFCLVSAISTIHRADANVYLLYVVIVFSLIGIIMCITEYKKQKKTDASNSTVSSNPRDFWNL